MTDPYRIRSPEVWIQARDDYVAGLDAEAVCRRHDLGLSAFRRRARKYGWRRKDQADPKPAAFDLTIYDDLNEEDEMDTARLRYLHALECGRPMEALRWRRLWRELCDENDAWLDLLYPDEPPARVRDRVAAAPKRDETEEEVRILSASPADPAPQAEPQGEVAPSDSAPREKVHDVHSIFSGVHISTPARPSKRAARRQRGREARSQPGAKPELKPRSTGP